MRTAATLEERESVRKGWLYRDVGNDDVRTQITGAFDELCAIADRADQVCHFANQATEAVGDHHMIVSENYPRSHRWYP